MTTLVDASELLSGAEAFDQSPVQIAARSLERLIREVRGESEAASFVASFQEVNESPEQLFDLLLSKADVVFSKLRSASDEATLRSFERTAEGFFTVVLFLLESFDSLESAKLAIDQFIDQIATNVDDSFTARVRIRSLMLLFNLFAPGTPLRSEILARIDEFASASPLVKAILRAHSGERPSSRLTTGNSCEGISASLLETLRTKGEAPLPENPAEVKALARAVAAGAVQGVIDVVERKIKRVAVSSADAREGKAGSPAGVVEGEALTQLLNKHLKSAA